ncbi:MAG: TIGR00730 family Rossman fold protein [Herpetosiphonaceae bacterium]|nr:TIGR00730 family Rossman fold protein [Herpetosiphonaceae bacterium]
MEEGITVLQHTITVYCSSSDAVSEVYQAAACELGRLIVERGYLLVYGGSRSGLMGLVSEAALAAGGTVIGIMPELFQAARAAHNTEIELIITDGMRARKAMMEDRADAFIALPGGFGTFEEVLEVITNKQLALHHKPIVLLNINDYYAPLLAQVETAVAQHFIRPEYRNLFTVATTPIAALDAVATGIVPHRA